MTAYPAPKLRPMTQDAPFWKTTPLTAMTTTQWESLCDGCGKCCLEKFEEEVTGAIIYSRVACTLLDTTTCRCKDYEHRANQVADCVSLVPAVLQVPTWLPETCAYRRLSEGKQLPGGIRRLRAIPSPWRTPGTVCADGSSGRRAGRTR
jgi:uncharacterized protein